MNTSPIDSHPVLPPCPQVNARGVRTVRDGTGIGALFALVLTTCLLLGGCSLLGGKKATPTLYAPQGNVQPDPAWPRADWQLAIDHVQVARPYDSMRIAVRPTPQQLEVYKGAGWAQRPAEMIETSLLRVLEDSGRIRAVARSGAGVNADYRLLLDVRRFESDYAGSAAPNAVIEINAKLLHAQDAEVVASRTFVQSIPAAGVGVPQVVDAFDRAISAIDRDIAGWTLSMGSGHQRSPKASKR